MKVQKSIVRCHECKHSFYNHLDGCYECKNKKSYRYEQELPPMAHCRYGEHSDGISENKKENSEELDAERYDSLFRY